MSGFNTMKYILVERGRRRDSRPEIELERQKEIGRSLGRDVDKEERDIQNKRIEKYLSATSKKDRFKMFLTHPNTSLAAERLRRKLAQETESSSPLKKPGSKKPDSKKTG